MALFSRLLPNKTEKTPKAAPFIQDTLPFTEIVDNVIALKDGGYAVVMGMGGININLMSAGDKQGLHRQLSTLFNILVGHKFQLLALIHPRDVRPLLNNLAEFRASGSSPDSEHAPSSSPSSSPSTSSGSISGSISGRGPSARLIEQSFLEEDFLKDLAGEGGITSRRYYFVVHLDPRQFAKGDSGSSILDDFKEALWMKKETETTQPLDMLSGGKLPTVARNYALGLTDLLKDSLGSVGFNGYVPGRGEIIQLLTYLLGGVGYGDTPADICSPPEWEVTPNHIRLGRPDISQENRRNTHTAKGRYVSGLYSTSMPMRVSMGWLDQLIKMPEQMVVSINFDLWPPDKVERKLSGKAGLIDALEMGGGLGHAEGHRLNYQKTSAHLMMEALAKESESIGFCGVRVLVQAASQAELKSRQARIQQKMRQLRLEPATALLNQEQFLWSTLPLGHDPIATDRSRRNMTTSAMVCAIPNTVMDLGFQSGSVLGMNMQDRSLVVVDRFSLTSYHKVIIAETGAGKTVSEFIETIRGLLQGYRYIWIDPQNTGMPQMMAMTGGEIIDLGPRGNAILNPLDRKAKGGVEATLAEQISFLVALLQLMANRTFSAIEESHLSKAIQSCYALHEAPILSDLLALFDDHNLSQLREELDRYIDPEVFGPMFNGHTNVGLDNACISFNIRDLEERLLRPIRVFQAIHYTWSWIKASLWPPKVLVIDEFGLLLRFPDVAQYVRDLFKRGRAFGLSVVAIDQNPDNFLDNPFGRQILENAAIWQLMKMTPIAAKKITEHLDLTEGEYLTLIGAKPGEAILVIEGQKRTHMRFTLSKAQLDALSTRPEDVTDL